MLRNKIALVTGASRGIGKAIALSLINSNVLVIGTSLNKNKMELFYKSLSSSQKKLFHPITANLANDNDINRLCDEIDNNFSSVDIIINNAGICFSFNQLKALIIAIFMISAAVPCIGAFIAVRSAYCRSLACLDSMLGKYSRLPYTVSTKPFSFAETLVFSMYSLTFGYFEKYKLIYSCASYLPIPNCLLRPKADIP